ncbi:SOS response-associated peptidase family protein [Methylocapsa sp. D3K7]|nr:SOS response-associated peptidase family protein [Methylocapsa sp. D3K7]WGJ14183.1 SOS response-associated peptidase family protein [Methylocapsa sp. D3K7]
MGSLDRPSNRRDDFECHVNHHRRNDFTHCIHDRMPVFLDQEDHDAWLTGKAGVEVLRFAPNDLLRLWPVSTRVNKSDQGDDDPSLIEAIEASNIG